MKDNYKSASLLAIYKARLVRVRTLHHHDRFAVAVLQGDSTVGYIPRESSRITWYFLRHGGEITCEVPCMGKPRNCLSYYLWRRLQTARTSCLPFNRLSSKTQLSQKISQKVTRLLLSISWKHEYQTICLQSHNKSQKSSQNATGGGGCVHFLE